MDHKAITRKQCIRPRSFNPCVGFLAALVAQTASAWPDLLVVKTGPAQAAPGELITYTLTYSNLGPVKSTGAVLRDFLPAQITALSNTLNGGTVVGSTISWSLGTLASGSSGSLSYQALLAADSPVGGYITNRSQIFGAEAEETGKTNNNYSTWITSISSPPLDFCRAILARQPIALRGTMLIDSFNSRDPNFSTDGRYDPNKRGDGGNIASISDSLTVITDTGNTKVYGRFETGPSGTVRITGNASVGSLSWVDDGERGVEPGWYLTNLSVVIPNAMLPGINFSTLQKTSGTVGGTNYSYVLNTGNYRRSTDLTLASSDRMVIKGNVVLYLQKKFTISGSALIYITPGSRLTVYLADITSLSGGGTVNGTGFATNCTYVGLPSCSSISFSGNSEYIGTVYAPQAAMQMSGGGSQVVNFIGSVVANSVDVTANYQFHFDQDLCKECLPPTILDPPKSLTNCPGTPATFSVSARGTDLRYAWFQGKTALAGETNNTLTLTNTSADDSGSYQVVVSVPCGDALTNSFTLTVNAPVGATELISLNGTTGGSATFGIEASGTDPFSYVWRKNDVIISGQTSSNLTLSNITRNDAGTYSVEVIGACGAVTRSATLTVVNSAPLANNDAYSLVEDTLLTLPAPGVLANDTDPDNDPLTAIRVGQPTHGTLTLNSNGSFSYLPANNYVGPDSFTYRANDGQANSSLATVNLTVTPVNDPPVVANDSYSTPEDTTLNISTPGVLGNDTDADGDALKAILVAGTAHGTLTLNTNGSFTYTPANNYAGLDGFTYKASDGLTNSGVASVSINVTPANDPPVAANDSYTTAEDSVLTILVPGVLTNDSDPDGDVLTTVLVTNPAHGTVTLNLNGSFTYTPANNYAGLDGFTYKASDGLTNSGVASVSINVTPVNDPPVAANDNYTTAEDSVLTILVPGVLINDSDVDGDGLTAVFVTNPAHGTVTLNLNGSFTYTPANNYAGPDGFTYKASDGLTNSGVASVSINVTPANDPPVAANDSYTTAEDSVLTILVPGVLTNDSDPDGDVLTTVLVTNPAHGTVTLNLNGSFTYTPANNYAGLDGFTYKASDGLTNSSVASVSINVTPVNDPPVAANDNYTTAEDSVLTILVPGVLINDSDVDGDGLTAVFVTNPAHGTVTLNLNGSFTYTPANNYAGPDGFTYKASDGLTNSGVASVSINVTPANDPPVAVNDSYTTAEDSVLTILVPGVLTNDSDPDGDVLTTVLVTNPAHGTVTLNLNGSFTYTPANNYAGLDGFTYKASDGLTNSSVASVSINVTPVNDPPVAANDNYTTAEDSVLTILVPGVLTNDSDPDGDGLSAVLVNSTVHGVLTLNPNGSFTYAPTNDYNGLDSFNYQTNDGLTNSTVATVTIFVTPVNDPPDTNNWTGKSFTVYEDRALSISAAAFLAGLRDRDGDLLSVSLVSDTIHGMLNLLLDGSFNFQPRTNFNGTDSFQFRVFDGVTNTAVLNASITVLPVNDEPSFTKGANLLVQQNSGSQTVPLWAHDISPGPTDEAGQIVIFHVSHDNDALFAEPPAVNASGTLTYTPAPNRYGTATVTVVAQDDGGIANEGVDTSPPQTFSITVNGPPTVAITSPTNGAVFFAPASFTVLADAQDPDGTIAKVEFFAGTNKLGEAIASEPYFIVLTNLPVGTYTYQATATDNLEATGTSSPVTLTVIPRPPLTVLSALHYNPQTDFFETRVRITNPTYSTLDAVRVYVLNLTNTPAITVHNLSGLTNNVPYIQTHAAVPPGRYVDMVIEFYSPLRIAPNPVLQPELVTPSDGPIAPNGVAQHINRAWMLANKTFVVELPTLSNRVYSVQYSPDLVAWKSALPAVTGDGNWVQWIDNGEPKTDSAPASQTARFYRVILLP